MINYKSQGDGPAVILLHGLFGDMHNLGMLSRELIAQQRWQVIQCDARNHGNSFHSEQINYPLMVADLLSLMDYLQLKRATLIGHSMGGKTAMYTALNYPERVSSLIVADIAPVTYSPHHQNVFAALELVHTQQPDSRTQADELMATAIKDKNTRLFLLKNLSFKEGEMQWRINLEAINRCYPEILAWTQHQPGYPGMTLFIKGDGSDYIQAEHQTAIMQQFPNARAKIIADTGHWLHAEKPRLFNRLVLQFLTTQLGK